MSSAMQALFAFFASSRDTDLTRSREDAKFQTTNMQAER